MNPQIKKFIIEHIKKSLTIFKDMRAANHLLKQITIPEKWYVHISHDYFFTQIMFIHHSNPATDEITPLVSYTNLCEQANKFSKMVKCFSDTYSMNSLDADSEVFKYRGGKLKLRIVQFQVDKCEIEYVVETKKTARVTGFCAEAIKN
jgi:hypothetical protein